MDKILFLALLISGLCNAASALSRQYYFVNESKTWLEAQSYCRENYTDLATVDNMEEVKQLMARVNPKYSGSLWIGLYKASPRCWGWSSGEIPHYMNWRSPEPDNGDIDGLCAAKYMFSGWIDADCTYPWEFVCYSESSKQFIHVNKQDSWRNAQNYCRQYYTDLATIHDEEEHQNISDLLGHVQYAWIGLFLDNWKWSDRRSTSFRYWMAGHPWSPTGNANCAVMITTWNGQWNDTLCDAKLPFMCYKALRHRIVKLTMTSNGQKDLNDPAMKTTILSQIEKKLRTQEAGNDTTLSWREKNGMVFHL
ncbi:hypothetical protein AOLI_G00213760 [Acnodon oligacanthus]